MRYANMYNLKKNYIFATENDEKSKVLLVILKKNQKLNSQIGTCMIERKLQITNEIDTSI